MGITAEKDRIYTVDEYLQIERRTGERYEFYNGKIQVMAGGTINHNRITRNVVQHLSNILDERMGFEVFGSDQKVYLPDLHYYVYPDVVVITDGPIMAEKEADGLINPLLVIEVLSLGTEKYDRNDKFAHYSTLPSLQEYVLIRQNAPHLISFFREAPDLWREAHVHGLDQEVLFKSIDVRLALELIYRKVEFPAAP
ncbi:MAG: Uma2 family endonuclease [Saprospiraceae bacterium]